MTRMDENTKRKEWLKLEKLVESKTSHLALFEALQVVQSNNGWGRLAIPHKLRANTWAAEIN